jgi:lysozyme family protein
MAASSYDEALRRLLDHEGGYTNDSADPGGPTNFGITLADYRRYVKPNASAADVKAMPVAEAKAIYRRCYWDAQACDDLPAGVDYAVFDYGVNSGAGRSGKVLRRCLGLSVTSAQITPEVIAAANAADAEHLIKSICDERLRFLKSLKTWGAFGRGWERRVAQVEAAALVMAARQPETWAVQAPTKVGAAAVSAAAAASAAHLSSLPLWMVIAIALAGALAAWAAIHFFARKKD